MVKKVASEGVTSTYFSPNEQPTKTKSSKTLGRTWQSLAKLSGNELKKAILDGSNELFAKLTEELSPVNRAPPKALVHRVINSTVNQGVPLEPGTRNNFFKALFETPEYSITDKQKKLGSLQKLLFKLPSNFGLNYGKQSQDRSILRRALHLQER